MMGAWGGLLLQPDGKILVSGRFNALNLTYGPPVVRFNTDGSLDASFDASVLTRAQFLSSDDDDVFLLAVQTDGRILLSGRSGPTSQDLVRLNANGSLDPTFNPRIQKSSRPETIPQAAVLNDGKILIAGGFDSVDGVARDGLARLNADGSLDTTFNPSVTGTFRLQSTGKLIVVAGTSLYRLNSDGSLDESFRADFARPNEGNSISSVLVQPDDKILFSYEYGYFDSSLFTRLNADGTEDTSFQRYTSQWYGTLVFLQSDGKVLIRSGSSAEPGRLNSDGTPDWAFRWQLGAVAQQSDGKLVTGGDRLGRLFLDGSVDASFSSDLRFTSIMPAAIWRTILLPNGEMIVNGAFDHFDLIPRKGGVLLKSDGTPDTVVDLGELITNVLAVQADGKLLAAAENKVVRINQNGSLDDSFSYSAPNPRDGIRSIAVQRDAKILVESSELVRLDPDGTKDTTFHCDQPGPIVLLQPDSKIVLKDYFRGLRRLNPDGSPDAGFTGAGLHMFNLPYAVALQPDGKFLISRPGLSTFGNVFVRLNSDGSADESFNPDVHWVQLIAVDQAGIYAAGQIGPQGEAKHFGICRFNFDGTRDPDFNVEFNPNATLTQLLVQPDGQLLVTGDFKRVNGVERHGIARVIGSAPKKLANISTRVRIGTGDSAAIGGFIITGNAAKKVIIRALGPSLQMNGTMEDTLANPTLEIHDSSGAIIGTNDDWRTQEAEIAATGLPPAKDVESAIVLSLPPGGYTAVIRGNDGGTGVALAEIYDLDPAADSTLANISTRGVVGKHDNVMIGGFILRGPEPSTVVVRALGPSLTPLGVAEALANPSLTLHDQSGSVIATNDDWKQTQQSELEAFGMGLSDDREAAVILTLSPGPYTAIVRGADGPTGVGLVEIYRLD